MRRLALARRGVQVRRQAARRRRPGQQLAVVGAADGDRAAGQVGQHRRAGQRGLGARRHRHPHVLADLDVQHEARQVGGGEQQVRAERHVRCRRRGWSPRTVVAGGELAALVELAVGGQVRLRHHTEHRTAVDHHRGVVDPVAVAQRRADDQHRQQVGGRGHQVVQRPSTASSRRVLQQDVVDRVAGQRQLREHRQRDTVVVAVAPASAAPIRRWPRGRPIVVCRVQAATRTKPCR